MQSDKLRKAIYFLQRTIYNKLTCVACISSHIKYILVCNIDVTKYSAIFLSHIKLHVLF